MKAADFLYHRPGTVEQAVGLLTDYDGNARVLAGGQSLIPMMNMRLCRPSALIDIVDIDDLKRLEAAGEETILGAMVRYVRIETDPLVAERLPLLRRMMRHVADRQVRNRGTIGGSLVQADPAAEMPLAALTLGAMIHVAGPRGSRGIPAHDFFTGSYATALEPDEMVTHAAFPRHPSHCVFIEVNRRHNDFAVVAVAAAADVAGGGAWANLRIGLAGVDETPVLARRAMARLEGSALADGEIAAAAALAAADINPQSDIRASADYRRHLTAIYVSRALTALRAGGKQGEVM